MNQTVTKGIIMTWFIIIATFAVLHLAIISYIKNLRNKIPSRSVFLNHPLYRFLRYNLIGLTLVYQVAFIGIFVSYHPLPYLALLQFYLIALFNVLEVAILCLNKRKEMKLFYMSPLLNTFISVTMLSWIGWVQRSSL